MGNLCFGWTMTRTCSALTEKRSPALSRQMIRERRACAALSLPQLVAKWAGAGLAMLGAKRLGVAVAA